MEVLWSEGNRDGVAFLAAADIVQNLEPSMSLLEGLPCQAVIATAPAPVGGWEGVVVACSHALTRARALFGCLCVFGMCGCTYTDTQAHRDT